LGSHRPHRYFGSEQTILQMPAADIYLSLLVRTFQIGVGKI
jgi:hypothetical protein